jgi:hypothetical protein
MVSTDSIVEWRGTPVAGAARCSGAARCGITITGYLSQHVLQEQDLLH